MRGKNKIKSEDDGNMTNQATEENFLDKLMCSTFGC